MPEVPVICPFMSTAQNKADCVKNCALWDKECALLLIAKQLKACNSDKLLESTRERD